MEETGGPSIAAPTENLLDLVLHQIAGGKQLLGQRYFVLGSGPVPISGASKGSVALSASGTSIFVVAVPTVVQGTAAGIADYLDMLRQMSPEALTGVADRDLTVERLRAEHAAFHGIPPGDRSLNVDPKAVVITTTAPSAAAWKDIVDELGTDLDAVYLVSERDLQRLQPPPIEKTAKGGWTFFTWLGVLGLLLGLGLTLVGAFVAVRPEEKEPDRAGLSTIESPSRTVASSALVTGTLAQWINQQRAFTTSKGQLSLLYPSPDGLRIVSDQRNGGRSWRSPLPVSGVSAVSLSLADDQDDRLHLVASDEGSVTYHRVTRERSGWASEGEVLVDAATSRQTVDIAWSRESETAHVVWVAEDDSGMRPMWARISDVGGEPEILESRRLSPAGTASIGLVNVARFPNDRVLVTYGRPNEEAGWFARVGRLREGSFVWSEEEEVPGAGRIGAASVEIDATGTVHLALRDDSESAIVYYKRTQKGGWTSGVVVADGTTAENIDFPSLALDPASGLVYLFHQTNLFLGESTEVVVMIRDPATGWEGPLRIDPAVPGGAIYPVTSGEPTAQPLVFWTALGGGPSIQAARVSAP